MIPKVVKMDVYPVAGHDSMELNLSGAHAPFFTRNIVVLEDSSGNLGVGEVPGGQKITNTNAFDKIGKIAAALVLHANDDVTFMSSKGNVVRLRGSVIPSLGRTARGVRLIRLAEGAIVAGVTANDADAIPEAPDEQTVTAYLTRTGHTFEVDCPLVKPSQRQTVADALLAQVKPFCYS